MIQTYDQLQKQTSIINELAGDTIFIQKIYSTSHFLCLSLRNPGKTTYLYIGRGGGYEGIWIDDVKPESYLRKRDAFLEYFRKFLSATQFKSVSIDSKDRIITIEYLKWRVTNKMSLFYKGRRLYFSHHFYSQKQEGMQVFKSWAPNSSEDTEMNTEVFDEIGRKDLENKETTSKKLVEISELLEDEKKLAQKSLVKKKKTKFIHRKISRIKGDLDQVLKWKDLQELASTHEDFSKFEQKTKLCDIKFNFREKDHFKRRNEVFDKVKKLKKAQGILEERLANTKEPVEAPKNEILNSLSPVRPFWNQKNKVEKNVEITNVEGSYKTIKFKTFQLAVGLSANGNDEVRKNWANKDDLWFHLEDLKSPHIVAKMGDEVLDENVLRLIGSVMIDYSDYTFTEANLIYTQVKNLKGVKGAAGMVNFKKEKHIKIHCLDDWHDFTLE